MKTELTHYIWQSSNVCFLSNHNKAKEQLNVFLMPEVKAVGNKLRLF